MYKSSLLKKLIVLQEVHWEAAQLTCFAVACGLSTSSALMSLHFPQWDWLYLSDIFVIYLLLYCMCVSHSKYARVCITFMWMHTEVSGPVGPFLYCFLA